MEQRTSSPSPGETTVKLFVGPEKELFEIREDLICSRCSFFANAFQGNFLEASTKTLTFEDDAPAHFKDLQAWLNDEEAFNKDQSWLSLSKSWLFAEKYHIDEMLRTIVDTLYSKYAAHDEGINIAFTTLDYIAENTFPRSPLRALFADMLTNGISLQQLPNRLDNIPAEFLQDMCLAMKSHIHRHGPANISLLSNPIATYYTSAEGRQSTDRPKPFDPAAAGPEMYCESVRCQQLEPRLPLRGEIYVCTNHNITLCQECRHSHHGHRKKHMSLTTSPYQDSITQPSAIIDAVVSDSGFYCDGPRCSTKDHVVGYPKWALQSGDRYHCMVCSNCDYCTACIRGPLACKEAGHTMLRIRPTFSRPTPPTERVSIKEKQRRLEGLLCLRCASGDHLTGACEAKESLLGPDVEVEE